MAYTSPIKFSKTDLYGCGPEGDDDVYTVEEFKANIDCGAFVDYDGYGHPAKNRKADESIFIRPSRTKDIPTDATHIVWYNR